MKKLYLVCGYVSWKNFCKDNHLNAKISTGGCIGYCPVFETFEDAKNYAKGQLIAEIIIEKAK